MGEWIALTQDKRRTTQAEYRYLEFYTSPHHLRITVPGGALNSTDDVLELTTSELGAIPIIKALVEILREFEEADIWGRSLGYLVCQMCGAKVTVGERFVHKDGCPYGVLVPFKEDNDDCI